MKRGDIVLVDYPFSDQTGSKVRPALVVLSDTLNRKLSHTVVAPITSSRKRFVGDPSQLVIDPSTPDWQQTGLQLLSVVLCENLATIQQAMVLKTLGQLPAAMMQQIGDCLKAAFDL